MRNEDEPNPADRDAVVLLSDWLHRSPYEVFDELKKPRPEGAPAPSGPDLADVQYPTYLINGKAPNAPWTLEV